MCSNRHKTDMNAWKWQHDEQIVAAAMAPLATRAEVNDAMRKEIRSAQTLSDEAVDGIRD